MELVKFNNNLNTYSHNPLVVEDGTEAYISGRFSDGVVCDGNSSFAAWGFDFHFTGELQGDAAFSCYIKMTSLDSGDIAVLSYSDDTFGSFSIILDSSNNIKCNNGWTEIGITPAIVDEWKLFVINWDWTNSTMEAFIDNVSIGSIVYDSDRELAGYANTLIVGNAEYYTFSNCVVDQMRFFNRVLSSNERLFLQTEESPFVPQRFDYIRSNIVINMEELTYIRSVENIQASSFIYSRTNETINSETFDYVRSVHRGYLEIFDYKRKVNKDIGFNKFYYTRTNEPISYPDVIIKRTKT